MSMLLTLYCAAILLTDGVVNTFNFWLTALSIFGISVSTFSGSDEPRT